MAIQAAILTVSDSVSRGIGTDRSGPTIEQLLKDSGPFDVVARALVPDDIDLIRKTVRDWVDSASGLDLILTTGGTGFGVRDRTPEALSPLIERPAPGIVHLLLSSSLQQTPLAALSRPLAGTYRNTLVITLPGSVRAVTENLSSLLKDGILRHALDLISGGSGRAVHEKLAETGPNIQLSLSATPTHHHHHHHHHHHSPPKPRTALSRDPTDQVALRSRQSPFPLIPISRALDLVAQHSPRLEIITSPITFNLCGSILAEDIISHKDIPASTTTNVDGYAIKANSPAGKYKVVTPASHPISSPLPDGFAYRINTGAPLPNGADAVIMVEDTSTGITSSTGEEIEIETLAEVNKGENTRQPGSDVRAGDLVLESGTLIGSGGGEVGTLAFVGVREVRVYRKPKIALLSTGDELIDINSKNSQNTSSFSGIYDTNRPSLLALLHGLGYETIDLGIAPDTISAHVKLIKKGLTEADMLVTTGGTSMGSTDLLKPVIEQHFEGNIHFGRVSVKPGKPTTFATATWDGKSKALFALPGNPASALVCFYLFVLPALRIMGGWSWSRAQLPRVTVKLAEAMRLDPRPEFHRVVIYREGNDLVAYSTGGQRSSRVASLSGANGLVHLPSQEDTAQTSVPSGSKVSAVVIGEILEKK